MKGREVTPSPEEGVLSFFRRTEIIIQVEARLEPEAVMPENTKTKNRQIFPTGQKGKRAKSSNSKPASNNKAVCTLSLDSSASGDLVSGQPFSMKAALHAGVV